MKNKDLSAYPEATGDGIEPFRTIAERLRLSEIEVLDAFAGLPVPEWNTPEQIRIQREIALRLSEAAIKSKRFLDAFDTLPKEEMDFVLQAGGITTAQLRHTVSILRRNAEQMGAWSTENDQTGGRNPAAYVIAEGMRRLFRRQRWKITFGQFEGMPTTDFTRAIKYALEAFGLAANWRGPAHDAFKKQQRIEARLFSLHSSRARR